MKQLWVAAVVAATIVAAIHGQAPAQRTPAPSSPYTGPAFVVVYLDMLPASRAEAIDALRKYQAASRREDGLVALDLFEQTRRGAYFNVVEEWRDAAALDAHTKGAASVAFLAAMNRLGISPPDLRP